MTTTTITQAPTTRGFGIAVLHNLRSETFLVARTHRGRFVVISQHATEAAARKAANVEWAADKRVAA